MRALPGRDSERQRKMHDFDKVDLKKKKKNNRHEEMPHLIETRCLEPPLRRRPVTHQRLSLKTEQVPFFIFSVALIGANIENVAPSSPPQVICEISSGWQRRSPLQNHISVNSQMGPKSPHLIRQLAANNLARNKHGEVRMAPPIFRLQR